jgi:hypothetical protein
MRASSQVLCIVTKPHAGLTHTRTLTNVSSPGGRELHQVDDADNAPRSG